MSYKRRIVCRSIIGAMVLALILLAGCGAANEVALDATDNGTKLEVQRGQTLVITLDANPTTGYRWERVASADGVLGQEGEAEFRQEARVKDRVGAGSQEILRFKAQQAGQTDLELVYHRPWEKDEKPAETFAIQVVVR